MKFTHSALLTLFGLSANYAVEATYGEACTYIQENFDDYHPGDIIEKLGDVSVTVESNGDYDIAMIFDSNDVTGGDEDLASPYYKDLGNVLIISEDSDPTDPDDEAMGGTFHFEFSTEVKLKEVTLLDIDHTEEAIISYPGGIIAEVSGGGDGSYFEIAVGKKLSKFSVKCTGSCAIPSFLYKICTSPPSPEPSDTPSAEPSPAPSAEPSPAPSPEPSPAPSAEPSPAPSPAPTATPEQCPDGVLVGAPILGSSKKCTVFQLGESKVSMSHGDPTGIYGNVCLVSGSELSRSGGQIVTGDVFAESGADVDNKDGYILGELITVNNLTEEKDDVFDLAKMIEASGCDHILSELPSVLETKMNREDPEVFCINKAEIKDDVLIKGDGSHDIIFKVTEKLKVDGAIVSTSEDLDDCQIVWYVTDGDTAFSGGGGGSGCCKSVLAGSIISIKNKVSLSPGRVTCQIVSSKDISLSSGSLVGCPEDSLDYYHY